MQSYYGEFEQRSVELAAISTDSRLGAEQMMTFAQAAFPILADTNADMAGDYGVFNLLGDGLAAPATFIILPDGSVIWSYIGIDIGDRVPSRFILQTLDSVLGAGDESASGGTDRVLVGLITKTEENPFSLARADRVSG